MTESLKMNDKIGKNSVNPSVSFVWKIPCFLRHLVLGRFLNGPSFTFCGEEWHLLLKRDVKKHNLIVISNTFRSHSVVYYLNVLCNDGEEFELAKGEFRFNRFSKVCCLCTTDSSNKRWVDKNTLSPDGILSISCTLTCQTHFQDTESITAYIRKY